MVIIDLQLSQRIFVNLTSDLKQDEYISVDSQW